MARRRIRDTCGHRCTVGEKTREGERECVCVYGANLHACIIQRHLSITQTRRSYKKTHPSSTAPTFPPSNSSPGVNLNPPIVPMPSRQLLIAVPTPMLHVLQPPDAERNTAQARDGADPQGPATSRGEERRSALASFSNQRGEGGKGRSMLSRKTHNVYPPDTCFVLLTDRCLQTGHWTGTGVAQKGVL